MTPADIRKLADLVERGVVEDEERDTIGSGLRALAEVVEAGNIHCENFNRLDVLKEALARLEVLKP